MTLPLITAVSLLCFMAGFWLLGVVARARLSIGTVREAMGVMRDPALDELEKEKAVQAAALGLVRTGASLIFRSVLCLVAAFFPIYLADLLGLADIQASLAFMQRWDVIGIATGVIIAAWIVKARLWPA